MSPVRKFALADEYEFVENDLIAKVSEYTHVPVDRLTDIEEAMDAIEDAAAEIAEMEDDDDVDPVIGDLLDLCDRDMGDWIYGMWYDFLRWHAGHEDGPSRKEGRILSLADQPVLEDFVSAEDVRQTHSWITEEKHVCNGVFAEWYEFEGTAPAEQVAEALGRPVSGLDGRSVVINTDGIDWDLVELWPGAPRNGTCRYHIRATRMIGYDDLGWFDKYNWYNMGF